jgi:hypothetical protein
MAQRWRSLPSARMAAGFHHCGPALRPDASACLPRCHPCLDAALRCGPNPWHSNPPHAMQRNVDTALLTLTCMDNCVTYTNTFANYAKTGSKGAA